MFTIPKEVSFDLISGTSKVTFANANADVNEGRLAYLLDAWLELDSLDYPLIQMSVDQFNSTYKYNPQLGLPRYVIFYPENHQTTLRLYPGASQFFKLKVYGKFEKSLLGANDTLEDFPDYYVMFLLYAVAKQLAYRTGRAEAWTEKLEQMLDSLHKEMVAITPVNVDIDTDIDSMLNGSWRVRAGI